MAFINPWFFDEGIDIAAAAIVVLASFVIFFKTGEFYRLSSHRGIQYFRYAFLFFGISFLLQLLRPLFHFFEFAGFSLRWHTLFIVVYIGNMAVLCLLYSVLWKKLPSIKTPFLLLNVIALLIALVTLLGRRFSLFTLLLQMMLFLVALIISYHDALQHKDTRQQKRSKVLQLHVLYTLLFFAWVTNVFANIAERRFETTSIVLNIVSVALFMTLLYKVLKKTDVTA